MKHVVKKLQVNIGAHSGMWLIASKTCADATESVVTISCFALSRLCSPCHFPFHCPLPFPWPLPFPYLCRFCDWVAIHYLVVADSL